VTDPKKLTIQQAQYRQPWTVPYARNVDAAAHGTDDSEGHGIPELVPHILGSHCVLHAIKSLGKIAAVYEARDHDDVYCEGLDPETHHYAVERDRKLAIRAAAADLITAALRFANLERFDLAEALVERVREKNGTDFGPTIGAALYCERCNGYHPAPECA
jgi:hypothetical protein